MDFKIKDLGSHQQLLMLGALDAYSFALFTRVLELETPRIQLLLAGVSRAFGSKVPRISEAVLRVWTESALNFEYHDQPHVPAL